MPSQELDLLLIYPPVAKPAEAPAGIAQIKNALHKHGHTCCVIDANIDGLLYLINRVKQGETPRLRSALKNREKNLATIRDISSYTKFDHYKRSVLETNRLLNAAGAPFNAAISFTNFKQSEFSPVRSDDLLKAASAPEKNPFCTYFISQVLPRIAEKSPKYIGISLIYLSQAIATFALIGLVRRRFPHIKIILGGGLITSWMSHPHWNDPFNGLVDLCISGRGEQPLLKLFGSKTINAAFAPDLQNINDDYFSPGPVLPYTTSYGCYWRKCSFCPETAECSVYEPTPHAQVFDDLERLTQSNTSLIHFLDNALSPALVKKIAERGLAAPWYGYLRFTPDLEDLDFCIALKNSGCLMLQLGLESGDQDVLEGMQKGIELQRVSRILRNLKKAGIATFIYLLFGTPWENEQQARRTVNFTLDHADCIQYLNPAIFNMPVFSNESEQHNTRHFYAGDLSLYHDFDHPKGWNRGVVRRFLHDEFLSHPVIKKIINANPPSFTSNHAPFFTDHFLKQ